MSVDLLTRKRELNDKCRKILDDADANNNGKLSADQRSEFDNGMSELDDIDRRLSVGRRVTSPEPFPGDVSNQRGRGLSFRDTKSGAIIHSLASTESVYRERSEISAGRCLHAMLSNDFSQLSSDETKMLAAHGGSDTAGGYLLPTPLSEIFVDLARSASVVMRAGATTLPMSTSELSIARLTSDPTTAWRGETVAVTGSTPTFDKVTLRPKTLAAIMPVSIELLEDATNAAQVIESALANSLGLALDQAALSGTGIGAEPRGVRNHASVNTIASVGTPASYANATAAVGDILAANYPGEVSALSWIRHPRDAETYDGLLDTTDQPLRPTPWAEQLRKFHTTSISTTEDTNKSFMVYGAFNELLIGMRTSGVVLEVLREGTITDSDSTTWNATTQLMRHVRAYLRADVALLRPTWFTVSTGVTA